MVWRACRAGTSALLAAGLLGAAWPAAGAPGPTVLAWVDGDSVTTGDLGYLLAQQKKPTGSVSHLSSEGLLRRLIQNRLLEHEGYRIGAEEKPEVRNQVWEFVRHRAMMALLDSVSADVPEPEPGSFATVMGRPNTIWRVAHILVENEATARALLDSLQAGVPFEDLARRHSIDSTAAAVGGDLGWARRDLYIPEFRGPLGELAKGEVSGPVRTAEGWHLLRLVDTRTETVGQSEEMRQELRDAAMRESVMKKVRAYVESLKEKYGVVTQDSLLATLDYASADPEVTERLHGSDEVLATLPWRTLTVADLTRRLRFDYFHGLEDRADAPDIRDRVFDEWLTELLLRHEAAELGFDEKPRIVAGAERLERDRVREVVVNMVLDFPFEPEPGELKAYWKEHPDAFTPTPRVRAAAVKLADESSARAFLAKVADGAQVSWLAARAPGVTDPDPAEYAGWLDPRALGLPDGGVEVGALVGPLPAEDGWTVARVVEMESVEPVPFDECRAEVFARMKGDRMRRTMKEALDRLESAAEIRIADGAHETIAVQVAAWLGADPGEPAP